MAAKIFKVLGIAVLAVIACLALLIGFLSITEYRPKDTEILALEGMSSKALKTGEDVRLMSWNIGYGALGDNADFFMDGGKSVKTADVERVTDNMEGVFNEITAFSPDILFVQEVDRDSARSEHIDEYFMLRALMSGHTSSFANNFKVAFLPYPVPPIGKVDSGIATFSAYETAEAERIQLPIPFSWPMRMANLKRCLLISRLPVEGSEKQLVLIDLHLEAYDDGEGKAAQTRMLAQVLEEEASKGNYVIAGGDFNQIFSSADGSAYPAQPGKWQAGEIDVATIAGDWQFMMDSSVPSCRSLDQPYEGADKEGFQYYLIDGFIFSQNIRVLEFANKDLGFVCSDHEPVEAVIRLAE